MVASLCSPSGYIRVQAELSLLVFSTGAWGTTSSGLTMDALEAAPDIMSPPGRVVVPDGVWSVAKVTTVLHSRIIDVSKVLNAFTVRSYKFLTILTLIVQATGVIFAK